MNNRNPLYPTYQPKIERRTSVKVGVGTGGQSISSTYRQEALQQVYNIRIDGGNLIGTITSPGAIFGSNYSIYGLRMQLSELPIEEVPGPASDEPASPLAVYTNGLAVGRDMISNARVWIADRVKVDPGGPDEETIFDTRLTIPRTNIITSRLRVLLPAEYGQDQWVYFPWFG